MSLFFDLLPTDLQIDILSAWLDADNYGHGLLKVLSALDVACSMSEQPSLRFLMAQLPLFGDSSANSYGSTKIQHIAECLQWLASRKVPVRVLQLAHNDGAAVEPLTLPLIETLHFKGRYDSTEALTAVLRCIPSLTAIHQTNHTLAFDTSLTPKLKVLTATAGLGHNCPPFRGFSLHLQELRLKNSRLTAELIGHLEKGCPNLRLLEVSLYGLGASDVGPLLWLLRPFLCLQELLMHGWRAMTIAELAAALPNIKRLTLTGSFTIDSILDVFDATQVHFEGGLEYLSVNSFVHSRTAVSTFELPPFYSSNVFPTHLTKILNHCTSLESFAWSPSMSLDMATLLVNKFDVTLTSLTVRCVCPKALRMVLTKCGRSLTSLSLQGLACPLALVASVCPHLATLALIGFVPTVDGLDALSVTCTDLKELTLTLEFCDTDTVNKQRLFSSIAKLRLRVLGLRNALEADATWFCRRVRKLQLLPVPKIILMK